uniref:Uncharacterized protein n=1 Tax=Lactuca sativa TaxID=4236 RepID=A0A9R1XMR8_LACSA|nr:hypothetical protein LSAT_V11C200081400 [Lactuca sativa]
MVTFLEVLLQSSQPSSPWFQGEPHSTGSSPSSSFTPTPSVEFKHAIVEGEPPVSSSFGLFQNDFFEGTFTSEYPPHLKEQYEDHPAEQIIGDLDSGIVTCSTTNNECLYASFLSMIEPKGIKEDLQVYIG